MKNTLIRAALTGLLLATTSFISHATIIASTDFDGRTVNGATASNLDWTVNGLSDPGNLTADFGLFTSAAANDRFAVDRNLHTEGSWMVDIALNVLALNDLSLSTVTLDAFIFNNAGSLQTLQRDLDLSLQLFDAADALLTSANLLNIYAANGNFSVSQPNGSNVSFDLGGVKLSAGNDYVLRLTASGQGPGNNAGIDNLVINGEITPVPAPGTLALFAMGLLGLALGQRKKR